MEQVSSRRRRSEKDLWFRGLGSVLGAIHCRDASVLHVELNVATLSVSQSADNMSMAEKTEKKRVLMVAYEFPPLNFSGSVRPFYFAKYLPDLGFNPTIISQKGFGHYQSNMLDHGMLKELDACCEVVRVERRVRGRAAAALEGVQRQFDRVLRLFSRNEHLATTAFSYIWKKLWLQREWAVLATTVGWKAFRRSGYDIIWATGPPWEALHVGYLLSVLTKRPLVADIRDPWTYGKVLQAATPKAMRKQVRWEKRVLRRAARSVYTSPLTTETTKRRSEKSLADRMVTITNGFDQYSQEAKRTTSENKCLFSYVGNLFRLNRQPTIIFEGLKIACQDSQMAKDIRFQFVGGMAGFEGDIKKYGIEDQVECVGYVSLQDSLRYMCGADVLVLLQTIKGEGNDVVGGKAYEYLAARKPILGIVSEDGGDAWLIRTTQAGVITGIDDPHRVAEGFRHYYQLWKDDRLASATGDCDISRFKRQNLARDLAALFDEILGQK